MAKKFSEVFEDEILDSKKPAGCIGGIFQLFDCQQLLGGRQLSEQGNRRDPSVQEKNQSRRSQEKSRYSMESSRTSFSSTFTSFSSLEHKSPQEEPKYTHHSFLSGSSPKNSPRARTTDISRFPAFKEIIKGSIYRDLCSSTIKDDDNKRNEMLKPIQAPRSLDLSKVSDLDESLRIAFKLKYSPCSFYEGHSRRLSYDGMDISQEFINEKQYIKHSVVSRLSLDSREGSLRCNLSPKFNPDIKGFDKNGNKRVPETVYHLQELESKEKSSSIVAKLMGLELKSHEEKNQIVSHERKHEKQLQSPRNTVRSPRRNNLLLDSPSKFSIEETPQMARGYVEENMNQKIESVLNKAKKRLQKLQCHHSSKETQDLNRLIIEAKKNGNRKLSSVNSFSTQLTPNYGSNKVKTSERNLKSPIVIMEPARKLDVSFSKVTKLKGLPSFGKIRTSDLGSNRRKTFFNTQTSAEKSFTENKAFSRAPHSSTKEQNDRAANNNVSPRLQQMKPDLKMKSFAAIPSYDSNKSPRRAVNKQLLDSVSPRCKVRNKSDKVHDTELQNSGKQVNVEAIRAKNSIEVKYLLFQQSIPSSSVKVSTKCSNFLLTVIIPIELKRHLKHPVILKDLSAKGLKLVSPQQSSPKSVPDAMLNQDGLLHSSASMSEVFKGHTSFLPLTVLKIAGNAYNTFTFYYLVITNCQFPLAEHQNPRSDRYFSMERPPLTIPSAGSSRTDSKISESKNNTIQGSRDLRTAINEARVTNATMFKIENQEQDSVIVAEIFRACGLLQKEPDFLPVLKNITSDKPSEFDQKSNQHKLHQKLIFDVVNEILAQKMDETSSGDRFNNILHPSTFSIKHLYKELCSEIKCLRSCKEGNFDHNSMTHKDVLLHSQAWDSFESEIPVLALEIERLIFKDLINEVVKSVAAVALDANQRRQRKMFAKDGI
ncbi:protein LONGIFOLIA 1-like [Dendrobium catenatum]|uniref:protein LONGIFOLIA 1-like n=1 Tax=Dendrobium catenatum TaxID=906689 RepID=UPI00109F345D|nr:protein LONGIFOLIA 1-like [Dendrobium catenatum]